MERMEPVHPATLRVIVIDPFACEVSEAHVPFAGDYTAFNRAVYELIDPGTTSFDCARIEDGNAIHVDDEGLLKRGEDPESWAMFMFDGYPTPLAGKGVIVGCNMDTGESRDCTIPLDEAEKRASFELMRLLAAKIGNMEGK